MRVTTDDTQQAQGHATDSDSLASTVKGTAVVVGLLTFAAGFALPIAWVITGLCVALLCVGGHAENTAEQAVQANGGKPLDPEVAAFGGCAYCVIVLALGALALALLLGGGVAGLAIP